MPEFYFACNAPANRGRLRGDPQLTCLASSSGSNRGSNPGFRRVLCRGAPAVVAHCPLHRRGSGRGDNPDCGSRVDSFAMRIDSIQRHATAHALAQGKVGRCHSKHSAKGSCQVRRVGKPGIVSSCGYTGARHQVAACSLQTEPKNIRPKSNSR